jgi:hypothetical protein
LPLADLANMTVVYTVNGGAQQTKVVPATSSRVSTTIPRGLGETCIWVFVTTSATALMPNTSNEMVATTPPCKSMAGKPGPVTNATLE